MAEPVTVGEWSGEGVKVSDVLDALEELRRSRELSATRAAVMTLVIVATDEAAAGRATNAVHELGNHHPARTLCLLTDPSSPPRLDAHVRLLTAEAEGQSMWSEDIHLVVRGPGARHLDSLIEPFTLADLPVVTWFVDQLPTTDDPLMNAADVLLVDARAYGDADCFARIDVLARHRPVVDISWSRLRPWRRLLALLFDGREYRPFVDGVRRAEVVGRDGPRRLLAGWLVDRLGLERSALRLVSGDHVALRLSAEAGGSRANFAVFRDGEGRTLHATATIEGGPSTSSTVVLPDATPAWGLADALSRIEHDLVYEHALRASLAL